MSTPSSGCSRFENVALPAGAAGWSLLHTRAACAGQRRERERRTRGVALCVLTFAQRRPRRALWPMSPWLSAHGFGELRAKEEAAADVEQNKKSTKVTSRCGVCVLCGRGWFILK